jgi:hypothetical protein
MQPNDILVLLSLFISIFVLAIAIQVFPRIVGYLYKLQQTDFKRYLFSSSSHPRQHDRTPFVLCLLSSMLSSKERDGVIGDLTEEYFHFQSKIKGRVWLYKQLIKSAPPLLYKHLKSRLASYFGERIR